MREKQHDIYWLPATVLCFLGVWDLVRGLGHTFLLRHSAEHGAGFDPLSTPPDQLFLLGAFGISNLLTGLIFILISRRARELSPYVLIIIPAAYLLGGIGIRVSHVQREAAFNGRYLMAAYLVICLMAFAIFVVQRHRRKAEPKTRG